MFERAEEASRQRAALQRASLEVQTLYAAELLGQMQQVGQHQPPPNTDGSFASPTGPATTSEGSLAAALTLGLRSEGGASSSSAAGEGPGPSSELIYGPKLRQPAGPLISLRRRGACMHYLLRMSWQQAELQPLPHACLRLPRWIRNRSFLQRPSAFTQMPLSFCRPCCRWWHRPRRDHNGGWRLQQAEALSSALQASSESAQHHEHMGDVSSAKVGLMCLSAIISHSGHRIEPVYPCGLYAILSIVCLCCLLSLLCEIREGHVLMPRVNSRPMRCPWPPQVQELVAQQEAEVRHLEALSTTLRHWREYT